MSQKILKRVLSLLLTICLVVTMIPMTASAANENPQEQVNLFDKTSEDNWLKALTLDGKHYPNETTYENIFTTHKISAEKGDTLSWGTFGEEGYVMEVYNANDGFVRRVNFSETIRKAEGITVAGVGGRSVEAYSYTYTILDDAAAYVRILGNISTMDDFYVYKTAKTEVKEIESVLNQKSVLFTGDSITDAVKDEKGQEGWAGRIGTAY